MAELETTAVATDGTPIVALKVVDKEAGTETPVNVATCADAVKCSAGIPMEKHLENLYGHANDESIHLTAEQKATMETQAGAQEKADTAKNEAIAAASSQTETAKDAAISYAYNYGNAVRSAAYRYTDTLERKVDQHTADQNNPHNVTAAQVGLGNVPNKSTNDQQPTFTEASALTTLDSGEKLTLMLGKIAKAISTLISHVGNKSNPHGVTASQTGAVPTGGGTMTGNLSMNGGHIILKEGVNYGTSLPAAGVKGRIFFKVVS